MDSASYASIVFHRDIAKFLGAASWTLSVFEHLITLDWEIENIWQRKLSLRIVTWVLNRYVFQLALFPIMIGALHASCLKYVRFLGAMHIMVNISSGLMLLLRVFALYGCKKWTLAVLLPFLLVEIALEAWAVAGSQPMKNLDGQIGCILAGNAAHGKQFAIFWAGKPVFTFIVSLMTAAKALRVWKEDALMYRGSLWEVMLRDGVIYFLVILTVNLTNILTYVIAPKGDRFINAPFTDVIACTMVCRLTINLIQRGDALVQPGCYEAWVFDSTQQDSGMVFETGDV
ncbi:hypothetical protein M0805_005466 [Coniferiporia weirii]|nr:hypothetical protein M0805_005466 [Coniferiporia weirii]